MSFAELLFALLLVALLTGMGILVHMVSTVGHRADIQTRELADVRSQLAVSGQARDSSAAEVHEVREQLGQATSLLEGVRAWINARHQVDDEARRSLRRLEAVLAGSASRGAAGENILEESFRHLPAEMVHRNLWVKGRVCEFGLRLPGGRLLAVDSKWAAVAALEEISAPDLDPARRSQLASLVEREVEKRVREVGRYIDPETTAPFALAAVPDAAFAVCRGAFAEAHRRQVIVVSYSMALPYLLAVYQMHLQFARSVDMENLQACLMDVERQLDLLDVTLENKLQRAVTMLGNGYQEGRQAVARARASVHSIQASEQLEGAAPLSLVGEARDR
jgi:DNA recombination protein RmuC